MMWFQRHEEPKIINDEFEQVSKAFHGNFFSMLDIGHITVRIQNVDLQNVESQNVEKNVE
jgi:hypothetical protein